MAQDRDADEKGFDDKSDWGRSGVPDDISGWYLSADDRAQRRAQQDTHRLNAARPPRGDIDLPKDRKPARKKKRSRSGR